MPADFARLGAEDALGDRALQPERTADGEDLFADGQRVGTAQSDVLEPWRSGIVHLEQREVRELVQRHNPDLLVGLAVELRRSFW